MRTLLIVRSHKADPDTLEAYDRYSALDSVDVVLCCDERNGPVDMGERPKVRFDADVLRGMGLLLHPRCGWRCGDYAYYVTRQARPDYDFYLLIEPDVLIHAADLNGTLAALNASDADFIAPRLYPRDERWEWSRTMRHRYDAVFGCIFPITRLSGRAVDHLFAARRAALVPESRTAFETWPNDEVFVATELLNHGFAGVGLDAALPGSYTRDSLRTGLPHDRATLVASPPDGLIYHPVRDFSVWFEETSAWAAHYGRRRRDSREAPVRAEVMRLLGMAIGSLDKPALHEAAVFPLMLARGSGADGGPEEPEAAAAEPAGFRDQAHKEGRAGRLLAQHFGPRRQGRAFATAHLLAAAERRPAGVASQADFRLGEGEPLHALPARFALPYAADFDAETLLFTIHPLPLAVLSAASVLAEQRRGAAVGCRVHLRHLARFYPPPERAPAVRIVVVDGDEARLAAAGRLRAPGVTVVADPPALLQLAANATRLLDVRPLWRGGLLWATIAPALLVHGAAGAAVFVVSDDIFRIAPALSELLPGVCLGNFVGS